MNSTKPTLLIPPENQVRKLDSNVLLTCVATRRGLSPVIGFHKDIQFHISYFLQNHFRPYPAENLQI